MLAPRNASEAMGADLWYTSYKCVINISGYSGLC